jgi:subtilisin
MSKQNSLFNQYPPRQRFTGRRLVKINPDASDNDITSHSRNASLRLASFADYSKEDYTKAFEEADGLYFDGFRIAIIKENFEDRIKLLTETSGSRRTFYYSEPERFIYAIENTTDSLSESMITDPEAAVNVKRKVKSSSEPVYDFKDDSRASWAIHAVKALDSKYTGKGINIAILDTGLNLTHPDLSGRKIVAKSFVSGQEVNDLNGHGSHCTGLATGNINRTTRRRYGIAMNSNIFAGKVLSNEGSGSDSSILAGMEWAISNKCRIISMSLGAPVSPGESFSNIYNDVAKKALSKGTIIIAAAGNESRRDKGFISPVGHPANCPSIMAVGALDSKLNIAWFSCSGINQDGGQVDIAAPGVDIYSSWKQPENYSTISGTSMATPIVAGIAALLCEAHPEATASEIWMYLTQNAMRLKLSSADVGAGLAIAPK